MTPPPQKKPSHGGLRKVTQSRDRGGLNRQNIRRKKTHPPPQAAAARWQGNYITAAGYILPQQYPIYLHSLMKPSTQHQALRVGT